MEVALGMQGIGTPRYPGIKKRQLNRATQTIRRLGGTALYVPDDYGLVLGPELSPGLASAAGWTLVQPTSGSVSISAGVLRVNSADGTYCNARFSTTLPKVGKAYRYVLEVTNYTGSAGIGTIGASNLVIPAGTGTKTLSFIADASIGFEVKRAGICDISISSISVREVISATTYIDSTGTQPVTAINDLVGLLTDRSYGSGNLGGELVTSMSSGWVLGTGWAYGSGTIAATAASGNADFPATIEANKSYEIRYTIDSISGGSVSVNAGVAAGAVRSSAGTYKEIVVTPAVSTVVRVQPRLASTPTCVISNISVREVLGNHASQPTTASKPLVTRVPKRLGPNLVVNGGFDTDTSGWTAKSAGTTMSVVSGAMRVTGTGAWVETYTSFPTVSGRTYRLAANVVATPTNVRANLSSTSFTAAELGNGVALTTAGGRMYYEFTAASATTWLVLRNNGSGPEAFDVDNITVQEVLEWTPALDFDGSNDLLTLSSGAILQQSSDHFVTAAFVLDAFGVAQTIYATSSSAAANPIVCQIWASVSGAISATWRDDAGAAVTITGTTLTAGVSYVATAARVGGVGYLFLNGTQVGTSSVAALGTTTVNNASIGASVRNTTVNYLNGKLIDIVIDQGTLTEADRILIETNMARRARAQYAVSTPTLSLDFTTGSYSVSDGEI